MKKITILFIFIFSFAICFNAEADFMADVSENNFKVKGDCEKNVVVSLIKTSNQKKVAYSSGVLCENKKFIFSENLLNWNLPEGDFYLLIDGNKTGKTVTRKENEIFVQKNQIEEVATENAASSEINNDASTANTSADLEQTENPIFLEGAVENLELSGAITIDKPVEFQAPTFFKYITEFFSNAIFHNKVQFDEEAVFNNDAGGYAIIKEGNDSVRVYFSQEYSAVPIVNANISTQAMEDPEIKKAMEEFLLITDMKYIITDITTKSFEIKLDDKAKIDVPFSWQAVSIKDVKIFSEDNENNL